MVKGMNQYTQGIQGGLKQGINSLLGPITSNEAKDDLRTVSGRDIFEQSNNYKLQYIADVSQFNKFRQATHKKIIF